MLRKANSKSCETTCRTCHSDIYKPSITDIHTFDLKLRQRFLSVGSNSGDHTGGNSDHRCNSEPRGNSNKIRSTPSCMLESITYVTTNSSCTCVVITSRGHRARPLSGKLPASKTSRRGAKTNLIVGTMMQYINFTTHRTPPAVDRKIICSINKTNISCRFHCCIRWAGNCSGGCRIIT